MKRFSNDSPGKWKAIPKILYKTKDMNSYFSSNIRPQETLDGPQFYKTIQNNWSEITEVRRNDNSEIIRNQILWCNRYITIQNRPFTWKKWKDAGIYKINDLIDRNGHFLSANEIAETFGIQTNFLEILQIRQSLPYAWRQTLENSS